MSSVSKKQEVANLKTFHAISDCVSDIAETFGKVKSIQIFNKLIENTTIRDTKAINRYINCFRTFFNNNRDYLKTKVLSSNSKIEYNERIYIDMAWVLKKLEKEETEMIYKHLLTIYGLINSGTEEAVSAVEKLKETANVKNTNPLSLDSLNVPDTPEGDFIKESLSGIAGQFENLESSDQNPMAMVSELMTSGFFQEFTQNLQDKFTSGEININTLISTAGSMVNENGDGQNFDMSQIMQMASMMGNPGNLPQINANSTSD